MPNFIYFNGEKYARIEEMPPAVRQDYDRLRQLFADADGDGSPDLKQSDLKAVYRGLRDVIRIRSRAKRKLAALPKAATNILIIREDESGIYINEQRYETPEDMPQEMYDFYDLVANDWQSVIEKSEGEPESFETSPRWGMRLIVAAIILGGILLGAWFVLL